MSHPPWWALYQSRGGKHPLGAALRYSLSYPGTFQDVFQLCLLCFPVLLPYMSMKPEEMMSCLQKAWQLDDKLLVQHYACINAGESFTMTNGHSTPTLILEVQKWNSVLCFVMINKKINLCNHRDPLESSGIFQSLLACALVLHCSEDRSF